MDPLATIIMQAINHLGIQGVQATHSGDFYNTDASSSIECETLTEYLSFEGFTYIGGGNFSLAFVHEDEPQKVYKVGLKGSTDGWLNWASYSLKHQGEPLIPVIHDVTILDDEIFIATLERVQTFDTWNFQQQRLYDAMDAYICHEWKVVHYNNWLNDTFRHDTCQPIKKQRRWALDYHRDMKKVVIIKHPLDKLYDLGFLCDTHEGNVGFNNKNHMVLIDPIAWQEGELDTTLFNYHKAA